MIGALALAIAFASATPGHRDRRLRGRGAAAGGAGDRERERGPRSTARRCWWPAGPAITLAAETSWAFVNLLLALLYLPVHGRDLARPEPEELPAAARARLREAVWGPFVGLPRPAPRARDPGLRGPLQAERQPDPGAHPALPGAGRLRRLRRGRRHAPPSARPPPILAAPSSAGCSPTASASAARSGSSASCRWSRTSATPWWPRSASNRPLMYAAQAFELGSSGLGHGAFGVLLLRLTQKRFSATQYALLSSLFTLPRMLAGPVAGVLADAIGWRDFFVLTVVFGVPGHGHARPLRAVGRARRRVRGRGPGSRRAARSRGGSRGARRSARGSRPCSSALAGADRWSAGLSGAAGRPRLHGRRRAAARPRPRRRSADWTTTAGLVVLAALGGLATAATAGRAARHRAPASQRRGIAGPRQAYHGTRGTAGGLRCPSCWSATGGSPWARARCRSRRGRSPQVAPGPRARRLLPHRRPRGLRAPRGAPRGHGLQPRGPPAGRRRGGPRRRPGGVPAGVPAGWAGSRAAAASRPGSTASRSTSATTGGASGSAGGGTGSRPLDDGRLGGGRRGARPPRAEPVRRDAAPRAGAPGAGGAAAS